MKTQRRISKQRERRGFRIGNRVRRSAAGRPRLSVFRSNKHIYAQVIDDSTGRTLAAASTNESGQEASGNKEGAAKIGTLIAERAVEKGITKVVFDRGQFRYHGRVAALADAARQGGLQF